MKLIIRLYSNSHDLFSFFMNSLLCFSTALFAFTSPLFLHFLYSYKLFFTCKEEMRSTLRAIRLLDFQKLDVDGPICIKAGTVCTLAIHV